MRTYGIVQVFLARVCLLVLLFSGIAAYPATSAQPPAVPNTLNCRVHWAATPPSVPVDVTFPLRRMATPAGQEILFGAEVWEGSRTLTPAEHPSGRTIHVRWYQTLVPSKPRLAITCAPAGFAPITLYSGKDEGVGSPVGPVRMTYVCFGVALGVQGVDRDQADRGILHYVLIRGGATTQVEVFEP